MLKRKDRPKKMASLSSYEGLSGAGQRRLALTILSAVQSWGYREVRLPSWLELERMAAPLARLGVETCKFIAPDQRVLVLLPDPTLGVLANRVELNEGDNGGSQALRLCYWSDAFRATGQGGWSRLTQVGAELLGPSSPLADAEVVTVAVDAITGAGIENFRLFMNDVALTEGLCDCLGPAAAGQALQALSQGDFVTLQRLTASDELLRHALNYTGPAQDLTVLLSRLAESGRYARDLSRRVLDRARYLEQIAALVAAAGYPAEIVVDISLVREVGYYDGFVFQILARGTGTLLAGGGRYDTLLAEMGFKNTGGAGFACNLPELVDLLPAAPSDEPAIDYLLRAATPECIPRMWQEAGRLRRSGHSVTLDYQVGTNSDAPANVRVKTIKIVNGAPGAGSQAGSTASCRQEGADYEQL